MGESKPGRDGKGYDEGNAQREDEFETEMEYGEDSETRREEEDTERGLSANE